MSKTSKGYSLTFLPIVLSSFLRLRVQGITRGRGFVICSVRRESNIQWFVSNIIDKGYNLGVPSASSFFALLRFFLSLFDESTTIVSSVSVDMCASFFDFDFFVRTTSFTARSEPDINVEVFLDQVKTLRRTKN